MSHCPQGLLADSRRGGGETMWNMPASLVITAAGLFAAVVAVVVGAIVYSNRFPDDQD